MLNAFSAIMPTLAARTPIPFQQQTDAVAAWMDLPASDVQNAFWTIAVGSLCAVCCALVGCFLLLRRMSLLGDALSHSVVPGVAGAYMLGLPFAFGAFLTGGLAAAAMLFLTDRSGLKTDVIIGIIFTAFFGLGLFMVSVNPIAVSVQTITMGNILAITPEDTLQLAIIGFVRAGGPLRYPCHSRPIGSRQGAACYSLRQRAPRLRGQPPKGPRQRQGGPHTRRPL